MNHPAIPCHFAADIRKHDNEEAASERAVLSEYEEARDEFMTGSCRPFTPENIAEALENIQQEPRAEALLEDLSNFANSRDTHMFGALLAATIEAYWQRQSLRVVQRRLS